MPPANEFHESTRSASVLDKLLGVSDVTRILSAIEAGNPQATGELLPLVYDQLRRLAAQKMAHERPGQTLSATELVHEAYLRLVGVEQVQPWDSRRHFFAAAAEAMRRILLNRARDKRRLKRGGGRRRLEVDLASLAMDTPADDLIDLDEALNKLADEDPVLADLVKLRFFAGLSLADAALALGIARRTADRYWAYSRAWLYDELRGGN